MTNIPKMTILAKNEYFLLTIWGIQVGIRAEGPYIMVICVCIKFNRVFKLNRVFNMRNQHWGEATGEALVLYINIIRMFVCLFVCLFVCPDVCVCTNFKELANRICMNSIWIEAEFNPIGFKIKKNSVRPSVRTVLSGHWTRLDGKSQKSSFFRPFSNN